MDREEAIHKLKTIVSHFDDSDDDDVWQKILNVAYAKWRENDDTTYADMISWVNFSYGPMAALAILFGKYNYQVCNGGHAQYFDNGYASIGSSGCFSHHKDITLHKKLVELFEKYCDIKLKDDVLTILKRFRPLRDEDDYDFEQLDDDYYAINDKVMEQVTEMYQQILSGPLALAKKQERLLNEQ